MIGEIGTDELQSLLAADDDADRRIVDIRAAAAFERGHIPDSENVPLQALVDDVEQFAGADHVVTVCPHGESSVQAARLIAAYEGFDGRVDSYGPGLASWDGPVDSGTDEQTAAPSSDEGPQAPF
jgi:rhodanese-related sulfurtransferase